MSFLDYVLPWKAVPNMIKDVKKASSMDGKGKYDSVWGAIGKYADPGGALMGDKWMDFFHGKIPREMNRAVQPWNEFHMKYLDPLAMSGVTPDGMRDAAKYKGADVTAAALGATALGMFSGLGAGGSGGGVGGPGGGSGSMWADPNTYMGLLQSPNQQQPQAGPPPRASARYGLLGQAEPALPPLVRNRQRDWYRYI